VLGRLSETERRNYWFAALFVFLLATRLCHLHILWAEEGYGAAGALQILNGKSLYRDIWFDKPPLAAWLYVLWGGLPGWPMRIAGTVLAWLAAFAAFRCGTRLWSQREGIWAAGITAFFLTFDTPAAVMTWAPDLILVPLCFAAVAAVESGALWWAGFWCAVALDANAKGILLLVLILFWAGRKFSAVLASFLLWFGAGLGAMSLNGSLGEYWRQVWEFGRLYASDTFLAHPFGEGVLRSINWLGFHAVLVILAVVAFSGSAVRSRIRFLLWLALAGASVAAGERFFPRYYLALLPPLVLLGARGLTKLRDASYRSLASIRSWLTCAVIAAALVPVVRFGPRYLRLAADEVTGSTSHWMDVALNLDSQVVASDVVSRLNQRRLPAESGSPNPAKADLLVWGYRPDLFVYTRLPAATHFLDSQMLTGVLADRHLAQTHVSIPEAAENRLALTSTHPAIIIDGLGPLNAALAIQNYPELQGWLTGYDAVLKTPYCVVYERK
jgi:4-amino-4-deoxy-L-arabinose transferase-like glycosyltransferase